MQRLPYKLAQNDLEFILCELSGRLKKKKIINYLARQDNPDYMKIAKYLNAVSYTHLNISFLPGRNIFKP